MILFRPVGLHELALIWDSGMRAFPPRLAHQPIFYPVANRDYAKSIAADWNVKDEQSGFAGYVTRFTVSDSYISRFEPNTVGSRSHVEYWVPAQEMSGFNASLEGLIGVEYGFFGVGFTGWIPEKFNLRAKGAETQFALMSRMWDYSRMDFTYEVSTNRKAVYLNFLLWNQHSFADHGITDEQKQTVIDALRRAWEFNSIEVPLPGSAP